MEILDIEHIIPGRILRVRLSHLGIKLMAWCVYSPTNVTANDPEKAEAAKSSFYGPLDKSVNAMKKEYPGYHCIIAGDWNATIGKNATKTKYVGDNLDDYDTWPPTTAIASVLSPTSTTFMWPTRSSVLKTSTGPRGSLPIRKPRNVSTSFWSMSFCGNRR